MLKARSAIDWNAWLLFRVVLVVVTVGALIGLRPTFARAATCVVDGSKNVTITTVANDPTVLTRGPGNVLLVNGSADTCNRVRVHADARSITVVGGVERWDVVVLDLSGGLFVRCFGFLCTSWDQVPIFLRLGSTFPGRPNDILKVRGAATDVDGMPQGKDSIAFSGVQLNTNWLYGEMNPDVQFVDRVDVSIDTREGNDRVHGSRDASGDVTRVWRAVIEGGPGDDFLSLEDGFSRVEIFGDVGNDVLHAPAVQRGATTTLRGGRGDDVLDGRGGGPGNTLFGNEGWDQIFGSPFDEHIDGGPGFDRMDGKLGTDRLAFDDVSPLGVEQGAQIMINDGVAFVEGDRDTFTGFELFRGTPGPDHIRGGAGIDHIEGAGGNDTLLVSPGMDSYVGSAGSDTLSYLFDPFMGVTVNLELRSATGVGYMDDLENVTGSSGPDTLIGDQRSNVILGGGGDDALRAQSGDDFLFGDTGEDRIYADLGDDTLLGGPDNDMLTFELVSGPVTVDMNVTTPQRMFTDDSEDMMYGFEDVVGSRFDDVIRGSDTANVIYGLDGDDVLDGRLGLNIIDGGPGVDTCSGSGGFRDCEL